MGIKEFVRKADKTVTEAVQVTRDSLNWAVVAAATAIVVALAAVVISVVAVNRAKA